MARPASTGGPTEEETTVEIIPQGYPLVVTIDDAQHLVIGWTRADSALAPITVPLGAPARPQVHDDEFEYTLPPQVH